MIIYYLQSARKTSILGSLLTYYGEVKYKKRHAFLVQRDSRLTLSVRRVSSPWNFPWRRLLQNVVVVGWWIYWMWLCCKNEAAPTISYLIVQYTTSNVIPAIKVQSRDVFLRSGCHAAPQPRCCVDSLFCVRSTLFSFSNCVLIFCSSNVLSLYIYYL